MVDGVERIPIEITGASSRMSLESDKIIHEGAPTQLLPMPPTWDPIDYFSFPVALIPAKICVPDDLTLDSLTDLKHIADGSNSNIFTGKLAGQDVIVKVVKDAVKDNPIGIHEFDVEHGILSRVSHPHIIRLLGAGRVPKRFLVLEHLSGGSLASILAQNQSKPGFAQKLFRRPSFTYGNLLTKARDIASALNFLHKKCHVGATIIHRGK